MDARILNFIADEMACMSGITHPFEEKAHRIISALDAAGFVICPKEPTEDMAAAGLDVKWDSPYAREWTRKIYRAMISAVTSPPLQKEKPQTSLSGT